jgi:hypothetical protein
MAYDDERPADWTSYDRIAGASSDLRFLLLEMRAGNIEQLRTVLGPKNYERVREYLDCIDANLKKMAELALRWAAAIAREGGAGIDRDVQILERMERAVVARDINEAWNIAEKWAKGD